MSGRPLEPGAPISLIATPRDRLITCEPEERIEAVNLRSLQIYDNIPVLADGMIVGLLTRDHMRAGKRVKDCFEPLSERQLVGATSSILTFVRQHKRAEARFVVEGERITGLVTLSDLQKLPARSALFGLVTELELVMLDAIEQLFPDDAWRGVLPRDTRDEVEESVSRAKETDTFTRKIEYTQLKHKFWILRTRNPTVGSREELRQILGLRNNLAHAKQYILRRQDEVLLSQTVCIIDSWISHVEEMSATAGGQ